MFGELAWYRGCSEATYRGFAVQSIAKHVAELGDLIIASVLLLNIASVACDTFEPIACAICAGNDSSRMWSRSAC